MALLKPTAAFPQLQSQKTGTRVDTKQPLEQTSFKKPNQNVLPSTFTKSIEGGISSAVPPIKFSTAVGSSSYIPQIGSGAQSARPADTEKQSPYEAPVSLTARPPNEPRPPAGNKDDVSVESARARTARQRAFVKEATPPAEALKKWVDKLTPYEQLEILEYPNIYFTGPAAKKIK